MRCGVWGVWEVW